MSKQTITENTIWGGNDPMYPDLSVVVDVPEPLPSKVTINMSGEYAQRLYQNLSGTRRQVGDQDTSILWRLLGKALGADK